MRQAVLGHRPYLNRTPDSSQKATMASSRIAGPQPAARCGQEEARLAGVAVED